MVRGIIDFELQEIKKKYAQPQAQSDSLSNVHPHGKMQEEETPDYPVHLFFTREGYFKKITPQSLRMSSEQKLKEGDEILSEIESTNRRICCFLPIGSRYINPTHMILMTPRPA